MNHAGIKDLMGLLNPRGTDPINCSEQNVPAPYGYFKPQCNEVT